MIINSFEILDANGKNLPECMANFKKGNQANYNSYLMEPINGLVKFEVPITDEELNIELKELGFTEHYMPRPVKLAVLAALRATKGFKLPKNTAVIGSTLEGSSEVKGTIWESFVAKKTRLSPRLCAVGTASTICTSISRTLNLTGPSFMITQACSGFITALDLADKFLNSGSTDVVLVVAVDSPQPLNGYMFNSMGVYTHDIVKPFATDRSGMALGEGAVCFLVTKEENAQASVAKITKISLYNDFYNLTAASPDGSAGIFLLEELGATKRKIDAINAHATGTKVGDDIELRSLEVLPYQTDVYGLKGSVGHTLAASAGIEMAYSISGLNEGWIPYTSTTESLLPSKHNIILHNIVEKETDNFIKLSFGFGGVSAGILVEKM
jgi:3-oxoacyl-(acyl-carrier-protein) synthase